MKHSFFQLCTLFQKGDSIFLLFGCHDFIHKSFTLLLLRCPKKHYCIILQAGLHVDSDIGFSKEYEEIQKHCLKNVKATHEHSSHPDNKCKNRYLNIVACKIFYIFL